MRILHIVTLISPDSAYGGPTRVAMNQCASLRDRGHDVLISATARGYDPLPSSVGNVPVRAFKASTAIPGIGFAGLRGVGMTRWIAHHASEFDVVHVHLARDFVTLPAARVCLKMGVPLVVQPHGMIDSTSRVLAKPLDLLWTRPVLRTAGTVFHLTPREARDLRAVAGDLNNLHELNNGVPQYPPHESSPELTRPEVLFLARLHPRKRPGMFVRMAHQLIQQGYDADFSLVGPDEGAKHEIDDLIAQYGLESQVRYEGPLNFQDATARLRRASIYVLPALNEPYSMSVLEAMAVGLPVVVTDTCGLAPVVENTGSGIVVGEDLESLTKAVRSLLDAPGLAESMGENARRMVSEKLSMSSIADVLERQYENVRDRASS